MAGIPIFGTAQKCVVIPPVSVPMKHTRSACPTTRFALSREYVPTTPTESGWTPGMESLPFREVATGIASFSARATNSLAAPDARGLDVRHLLPSRLPPANVVLGTAPAGEGDHGRVREMRVAQARREIERADHLRHADARPARGACVAVGHVSGGFFAVGVNALDFRSGLHLGEGPAQHRGDHEDVRDAVALQHVREALSAGDFCHG